MQNWKLIHDTQTVSEAVGFYRDGSASIRDAGFASYAHPKLKFNFTVDITFRSGSQPLVGAAEMHEIDIPVKSATRPNPTVVYTDINYYNYRTRVATKTDYGTTSITFYDDADNKVQNLYKRYLNSISPISNLKNEIDLNAAIVAPFGSLSSLNALPAGGEQGLIRTIKLHHYYENRGGHRTTYTFMNPKINTFMLDEMDMSVSDVNTITLEFGYDGFSVTDEKLA